MDTQETGRSFQPTIIATLFSLLLGAPVAAVELDLYARSFSTADLHTCGIHVTGSADLEFSLGLGIEGGFDDRYIDGTESIEFDFDQPQTGVSFEVNAALDIDNDGTPGRSIVEAFDAGGASLGIRMLSGIGEKDLTPFYGSTPISRVLVTTLADGIRLSEVSYQEVGSVEIDLENGGYLNVGLYDPAVCSVGAFASGDIYYGDAEGGAMAAWA